MSTAIRILFLSDTHLGFDMPSRPRVERRRRGEDFFENFERALAPVFAGGTDLVVHGGDLFYRSRIPGWLADKVYGRLADVADAGTDVFLVPGNHERSGTPRSLFLTHPAVHVFDCPRTFRARRQGIEISLSGFPYSPRIGTRFPSLLEATGFREVPAQVRLLCIHQLVEGARVGPSDFTFRPGDDVLAGSDIPGGFAAVLAGHVHRHQVLTTDMKGRKLSVPVLLSPKPGRRFCRRGARTDRPARRFRNPGSPSDGPGDWHQQIDPYRPWRHATGGNRVQARHQCGRPG